MNMRSAYLHKFDSLLTQNKIEVDKLKGKLDAVSADARIACEEQLESLGRKEEEVRVNLEKIRCADNDSWEHLKSGVERSWRRLDESVRAAVEAL